MGATDVVRPCSLDSLLADLVGQATSRHQVPDSLAAEARAAAARRFSHVPESPLSERERRRIRSYFWAVVRRRALRSSEAARFTARLVRASIAEDLRQAGLAEDRIVRELARCTR